MKKMLAIIGFVTAMLFSQKSNATIILIINDGLNPGVTYDGGVESYIRCSKDGSTGWGECKKNAAIKVSYECPTWADIKNECPNAIVINVDADNQVAEFISDIYTNYIDNGTMLSGNEDRTFYNVDTGETYKISIAWEQVIDAAGVPNGTQFTIDVIQM